MDTLRVEANERVDYGDFNYAVNAALEAAIRNVGDQFLTNPAGTRAWILNGFAMTNPSGKQLNVTLGRAILSARIDGQLQHGYLTSEGDLSRTIDMTGLSPDVYTVYLRFELVDGDNSSRIFWDPAGSGSEFASTIATRRKANWSVRVETTNPGAEWLAIGLADNSGVGVVITDQRKFYFEGPINSSYQSGWSTDGGGNASDRNSNRSLYGIYDFQTFTGAMRQCLEDIKGRGLRRWWERDIGGLNVGFDGAPSEDRIALGDANCFWDHGTPGVSSTPYLAFEGSGTRLEYSRLDDRFSWWVNSIEEMRLNASGLAITNGLYVGSSSGTPTDNKVYAEGDIEAAGYLRGAGRLYLGSDDYLNWDGTNWQWFLNSAEEMRLTASGLAITNGLYVGSNVGVPADNTIHAEGRVQVGDTSCFLDFAGGNPQFALGTNFYDVATRAQHRRTVYGDNWSGGTAAWMVYGKPHTISSWPGGGINYADGVLDITVDYDAYVNQNYLDPDSATYPYQQTAFKNGDVAGHGGHPAIRISGTGRGGCIEFWSQTTYTRGNHGIRGIIGNATGVNNEMCIGTMQGDSDMEVWGHRLLELTGGGYGTESGNGTRIWCYQHQIGWLDYVTTGGYTYARWYMCEESNWPGFQSVLVMKADTVGNGPSLYSNSCAVFGKKVGSYGEVHVKDGANNVTQISPHDPETGRWVFDSVNLDTKIRKRVDMERLIAVIEKLTGESLMEVSVSTEQ